MRNRAAVLLALLTAAGPSRKACAEFEVLTASTSCGAWKSHCRDGGSPVAFVFAPSATKVRWHDGRIVRPFLVIDAQPSDAYVSTTIEPSQHNEGMRSGRYRFDSESPQRFNFTQSTDGSTFELRPPIGTRIRADEADTLYWQIGPPREQWAAFPMRGVDCAIRSALSRVHRFRMAEWEKRRRREAEEARRWERNTGARGVRHPFETPPAPREQDLAPLEALPVTYPSPIPGEADTISVDALVTEDGGSMIALTFDSRSPLAPHARGIVQQLRWRPEIREGRPRAVWVRVPVRFVLH